MIEDALIVSAPKHFVLTFHESEDTRNPIIYKCYISKAGLTSTGHSIAKYMCQVRLMLPKLVETECALLSLTLWLAVDAGRRGVMAG